MTGGEDRSRSMCSTYVIQALISIVTEGCGYSSTVTPLDFHHDNIGHPQA